MYKSIILACGILLSSNATAFNWEESDKQKHIAVSTGIATLTYGATNSAWMSMGACVGAGLAKELYDKHDYGEFSSSDMQANAIGCGVGMALGYLLFDSKNGLSFKF
jgi:hypothetical protein